MRKYLPILVCCISLCSITLAWDFNRQWPRIRRYIVVAKTNVVSTNSGIVVSQNEHNVYLGLDTNVFSSSTNGWNWITANSNAINYMYSRTQYWDEAYSWLDSNTNYIQDHTSEWDKAWAWVTGNSNDFDYVQAHSNEWDNAYTWITDHTQPDLGSVLTNLTVIYLTESAAPATPENDVVVIYVDSADGDLKAKDDDGEVKLIADFAVD